MRTMRKKCRTWLFVGVIGLSGCNGATAWLDSEPLHGFPTPIADADEPNEATVPPVVVAPTEPAPATPDDSPADSAATETPAEEVVTYVSAPATTDEPSPPELIAPADFPPEREPLPQRLRR